MAGIERRTVLAAAWATPVIAVAMATPAHAASEAPTGTLALSEEYYSTGSFFGGSFAVTGVFTLTSGRTYPTSSSVTVSFADPLPLTIDGPISVDPSNGTLSFTVVFAPTSAPQYSETVMTVSAPGFAPATAVVYVPEPD
jgi:hypothetical protein